MSRHYYSEYDHAFCAVRGAGLRSLTRLETAPSMVSWQWEKACLADNSPSGNATAWPY